MGSPFKMGGHTLPGPNQKKSPMKILPLVAAALISAASTAASTAASQIAASKKRKADKKAQLDADAKIASQEGTEGMAKEMTSTKIV